MKKTRELDERERWLRGIDAPNGQICWISKVFELVSSGGTLVQTFGKLLVITCILARSGIEVLQP